MKKTILIAILAPGLAALSPHIALAQGTLYVSNLGFTSSGSSPVGSDSWRAAVFATGTNAGGYLLDSVQLALGDAAGNPTAFTAMLYTSYVTGGNPRSSLGALNGSLDPVAAGMYTYSPTSSLSLSPHTLYWVVLTSGTPVADGAYRWSLTSTYPPVSSGGWVGGPDFLSSSDGLNWQRVPGAYAQFAIAATDLPVPEPPTLGLLVLGGFFLVCHRRKARAVSG
jgi:hypothetical protein